jgi:hypothetical protein
MNRVTDQTDQLVPHLVHPIPHTPPVKPTSHEIRIRVFSWGAVILAAVGVAIAIWGLWQFKPDELEKLGTFYSGSVAALWSLAALVLIYVAFLGQRVQIDLQQAGLMENRADLDRQRETLGVQQFEGTFFQLLSFHHLVTNALKVRTTVRSKPVAVKVDQITRKRTEHYSGRQVFEPIVRKLVTATIRSIEVNPNDPRRAVVTAYDELYPHYANEIGHYLRNLYHLVKYVDSHPEVDRRKYTAIVRAQLSGYETVILFYNGLTDRGSGFFPFIENYALLEHMPFPEYLQRVHLELYSRSAWGNRTLPWEQNASDRE